MFIAGLNKHFGMWPPFSKIPTDECRIRRGQVFKEMPCFMNTNVESIDDGGWNELTVILGVGEVSFPDKLRLTCVMRRS